MRQVDQLLAGDARKEVLVATGEPDDLVREHRTYDDRYVGLGDVPIDPNIHGDVSHQPTGQLDTSGLHPATHDVSGSHDS